MSKSTKDTKIAKDTSNRVYAASQGIAWMAADEVATYRDAQSEHEIGQLHAGAYRRRARLNELDRARVRKLAGDPSAIQAVFDRAGLELTHE